MLITADLLLPWYREALADAVAALERAGAPPCTDGDPVAWTRRGELLGWLDPADGIRIRQLARKVAYYGGQAGGRSPARQPTG